MFQSEVVEKIKTHVLCSITYPPPPPPKKINRAFYEVKWKNFVERGRPQMTIWRMHITCWIPKATNAHSIYVVLITSPLRQWLHERALMLRNTYSACLVLVFVMRDCTFSRLMQRSSSVTVALHSFISKKVKGKVILLQGRCDPEDG